MISYHPVQLLDLFLAYIYAAGQFGTRNEALDFFDRSIGLFFGLLSIQPFQHARIACPGAFTIIIRGGSILGFCSWSGYRTQLSTPVWNWLKGLAGDPAPVVVSEARVVPEPRRATELIEAGVAAEERGDPAASERFFREAVAAEPGSAKAHMNLGIALHGRQEYAEAVASHERALNLDPALHSAHHNLGLSLLCLGAIEQAEGAFREAVRLSPDFPEAWVGLAEVLEALGRDGEALAALQTAMAQRKEYVGALFNATVLLRRLGRLDEAAVLVQQVPEEHPQFANAMIALAATLRDRGQVDDAVAALRAAVRRASRSWTTLSELLFTLGFSDRISAEALFAEHFRAGCRLELSTPPWVERFPNAPDPERILRIGYLSGDLRQHSVALFVEFLFERHRRDRVRVYAYSSAPKHDAMSDKIRATVDAWRDMREQDDETVARAILEDQIDILVDLSGHTGGARIAVLAGRAAPVQMTWLGYINTTGLTRVDYRITDAIADPPGMSEALHTEALVRMPHSQWCFRPSEDARQLPAARDPSLGAFTFGVMNQFAKVSESTIALWIEVLRANPEARLRVVNVPHGSATDTLTQKLVGANIDQRRFDLLERVPRAEYFRQYGLTDACLDTTPYSGGTTTCDALYFGVPVITLAGARPISRSTASLLTTVRSPELVARNAEEFVAIACRLTADGTWPNAARAELRARMVASPLMDEQGFTHDLEALYRQVWRDWCGCRLAPAD